MNLNIKSKYKIVSLRVDMAAEIVSEKELIFMKNFSKNYNVGLTVKIGGCDATTDVYITKKYGATSIIAPMIETDYSLSKFVNTCLQIYNEGLKDINLFINIETATAYNNLELILESPYIKYITGIVLGRDDMATSSNIDLNDINSDKMLFITNCIAEKVYKHNKKFIVGGCIRPDAIPFLKKIPQAFLSNYETRRVVFSADALQYDNVKDGLEKALEFEIKCIKTVSEFYNQNRINHLKEYLKPINLSAE